MNKCIKFVLLGYYGAGKEQIIERYVDNKYREEINDIIGTSFRMKTVECIYQKYQLQLWNPSGSERYQNVPGVLLRYCKAIFIVVDSINDQLQRNLYWIDQVKEKEIPLYLVLSKTESSERKISREEVVQFTKQHQIRFIEVSAKTGLNVSCVIDNAIEEVLVGEEW